MFSFIIFMVVVFILFVMIIPSLKQAGKDVDFISSKKDPDRECYRRRMENKFVGGVMKCTFIKCRAKAEYYAESRGWGSIAPKYEAFCDSCFQSLDPSYYVEVTKEEFETNLVIES